MSAPCPKFGFIISAPPTEDTRAFARAVTERLAVTGLEVEATDGIASLVITREGSQATESDRQLVIGILRDELGTTTAKVSDLVDLNY
jgi:hypothetical protein